MFHISRCLLSYLSVIFMQVVRLSYKVVVMGNIMKNRLARYDFWHKSHSITHARLPCSLSKLSYNRGQRWKARSDPLGPGLRHLGDLCRLSDMSFVG